MSRQSKAAKKKITAQQFTKLRQAGDKGPAQTKPLHGKVKVDWKIRHNKLIAEKEAEEAAKQKAAKAKKEQKAADAAKTSSPTKAKTKAAKPATNAAA
jgi:hypothetical protein